MKERGDSEESETSTLYRSHKTLAENNKKNSCNGSLHIKLSCKSKTILLIPTLQMRKQAEVKCNKNN